MCYLPSPGHGRQTPLTPNLHQSIGDFLLFPDVRTYVSFCYMRRPEARDDRRYKYVQYERV